MRSLLEHAAAGRYFDLERNARALLEAYPDAGQVWKVLGLALWTQGRDPLPALKQATALLPEDAEAHTNLGNAYRLAGQLEDATQSHRRALVLKPTYADAHNNLGSALRDLGCLDDAAASYRRAIAIKPDFVMAYSNLGGVLHTLGKFDEAIESYRRAISLAPADATAQGNLGDAFRALWRLDEAVACYRQALTLDPGRADILNKLGNALFFLGRHDDCAAVCQRALEIDPGIAEVHSNLAMVLMLQNQAAEAESRCQHALTLNPRLTGAILLLAELRANQGRFAEAEELLRRAISIEPDMPEAWAGLIRWRKVTAGDQDWRTQAQRIAAQNLPPRREVHLRYALGKYFDDLKDFEQAFPQYQRANDLTKQYNAKFDRTAHSRYVDMITQVYDREWLQEASIEGSDSERPIFIVGMWRSGSTLTEQILASHPAAFGGGEMPFWRSATMTYERAALNGEPIEGLIHRHADDYLKLLHDLSADSLRVVDKMLANFLNLGLIHAAFPRARILHMRRNPIDTCLSIYFQDLHSAHLYANDLTDLAHYYSEYLRVMTHWHKTLPTGTVLEVPYEELVQDQELWTRRILDFVGLPWDPGCLNFQRTDRSVLTVSKWQVRQSLHKSSVARWRNYERFIGPLLTLAEAPTQDESADMVAGPAHAHAPAPITAGEFTNPSQ
jgi:tetratricopeptide (TPR) repeat protein